MEIVTLRRRELLAIWALFTIWVFSQYMYRYAHAVPYTWAVAWDYTLGFLQYMVGPWAMTLLLAVCGYVVGRATIRMVARGIEFRGDLEEAIYAAPIGLGLIATLTFLLGLAKLLYPFLFGLLALLILVSGFRHLTHLFRVLRRAARPLDWNVLDGGLLVLLAALLLNSFLLPNNSSVGYDPINSHLCAPKFYLREHAIAFYPWINFNNFPQIQEMLLTLEMMVFKDPGCSMMYLYVVLTAGVTYLMGARYFSPRAGLIGAILVLLFEVVYRMAMGAFVEPLLVFYAVLLVHAFLAWYESRDSRWLVLLGVVGGLACGVKYSGAQNLLGILILVVLARFLPLPESERESILKQDAPQPEEPAPALGKKRLRVRETGNQGGIPRRKRSRGKSGAKQGETTNSKSNLVPNADGRVQKTRNLGSVPVPPQTTRSRAVNIPKCLGIILLWTILITAPWYIRNIVLFGNPFFPFYESIFGGLGIGTLDLVRDRLGVDHAEMLKYFHFEPTIPNLLALPWNFTFHHIGPWLWQDIPGPVGPFLLAFTPAIVFVRRWPRTAVMLLIYLVLFYFYWFVLERMEHQRYLISVYPIHALIIAWALGDLFRLKHFNPRNRVHLGWLMLVIVLGFGFFYRSLMGSYTGTAIQFLDERRTVFMRESVEGYYLVEWINDSILFHKETDPRPRERAVLPITEDTVIYGLSTENLRYYFDCPMIGGLFGYASHFEFMEHASTGQELYDWLTGLDCTWLLFNKNRALRQAYAVQIEVPQDDSFEVRFELVARSGDVQLYHLLAPGEPRLVSEEPAEEEAVETDITYLE